MKTGPWTEQEKKLLSNLYSHKTRGEIAQILNRAELGVSRMILNLGLSKRLLQPWLPQELEILRLHYPVQGAMVLAKLLKRNQSVIRGQAQRMGLKAPPPSSHLPLGTERLRRGGFWYRKVSMTGLDQWKPISKLEQSPELLDLYRLLSQIHQQVNQMAE